MAVNTSRRMSEELFEGMTDNKYKKVVEDRGGEVDMATYVNRESLDDTWYGIHERKLKALPDGRVHVTPDYVATPSARLI
jgi:hypothetical protein